VCAGNEGSDVFDQDVQFPERRFVHSLGQAGLRKSAGGTEAELVAVIGDRGWTLTARG
jgi:hypothetical protein